MAAKDVRAAGDWPGLEAVFRDHQARVFRAAYRVTGNAHDAEDVLQTVFLRLLRREGGLPPVSNLPSYLYRSAVNTALDVLRTHENRTPAGIEEAEAQAPSSDTPERASESGEIRARLRRALARLPPQAASVFVLRYLEGHENQEIAGMLGLSRVAVAVSLHRTRRRLQRELQAFTRTSR